jgi:hypothetical protein
MGLDKSASGKPRALTLWEDDGQAVKSQHHQLILIGGLVERCALSILTRRL